MKGATEITVITPTEGKRPGLLAECEASVAAQTRRCVHLIGVDEGDGPAPTRNALVAMATTEFIAFLDDDDLMDPDHLEKLHNAIGDADMAYSWCRGIGTDVPPNLGMWQRGWDPLKILNAVWIPVTVLMRRESFWRYGGFPVSTTVFDMEDWALWRELGKHLAKVVCLPEQTWSYRFGHDQRHRRLRVERDKLARRGRIYKMP